MSALPPLHILLAAPRGFCAGVDRAIQIVEKALERYGAPVYVRHEIVHNKHVVNRLKAMGAVFVKELDECPDDRPVVFSAHGVPKRVPETAKARNMLFVDATCPLVSKVHVEASRHHRNGLEIVLIGHAGHPEVIGTMGQLPEGAVRLIETREEAETIELPADREIAYVTQTTLSVDDTAGIIEALRQRIPQLAAPKQEDICYATTNRQQAVKAIAPRCDAMLVIGAPNSSNSKRLVEVARVAGCPKSMLLPRADQMDWTFLDGVARLGITAGASAPEILVDELIAACRDRFEVTVEEVVTAEENIHFKLPKALSA